jgi:putative ABC transport system permease protein
LKLWQAFKMAFRSIWGNKGRSILTMLGIIIGIAAVMTIVSILQGMTTKSMEMYEAMGSNKINVMASANNGLPLFDDLYDYCLQLDDLVEGVTPQGNLNATVVYGVKNSSSMEASPNFYLGSHQYSLCNNFQIERGRDLSKIDVDEYKNVCVLGYQAAVTFFDLSDPLGKSINVNGVPFTVIGVYAAKDQSSDPRWSLDNMILFPYTASRTLKQDMSFMSQFVVKAKNSEAATEATTRIIGFLTGILGDPNDPSNQRGNFDVYSEDSWKNESQQVANMFSLVLGGIAGISLLVGGIGIMNIMLVTVTERTREIGIRRAIGAKRKAIVTQFLIESGVICGIGGIIGVLLGTILTLIGSQLLLQTQMLPSPIITLGAVLFSVALGIIFGLYPAIKASGLQPVVALRAD